MVARAFIVNLPEPFFERSLDDNAQYGVDLILKTIPQSTGWLLLKAESPNWTLTQTREISRAESFETIAAYDKVTKETKVQLKARLTHIDLYVPPPYFLSKLNRIGHQLSSRQVGANKYF